MKKHLTCAALLTALLIASGAAKAQEPVYPHFVPLSGTLTDAQGKALPAAERFELLVRLYKEDEGGSPLYEESFEQQGGHLHLMLGANPDPSGSPHYFREPFVSSKARFVELVVDGEVLEPRILLGSVPYAHAAHRAEVALHAMEAGDAASLQGMSAGDFLLSTYRPSWDQLTNRPDFTAQAPLHLGMQAGNFVFGLTPCGAGQTLVWGAGAWGCHALPAPLMGSPSIKILNNRIEIQEDSVESYHLAGGAVSSGKIAANAVEANNLQDAAVSTSKIANNAIQNQHIAAGSLLPNKIAGGAVTLLSNAAQTIQNTLTIAQGAVSVQGSLSAASYKTNTPSRRTYQVWAEQFRALVQSNAPELALTNENQIYLLTAPVGASTPYSITLLASLPSLPSDAELDTMRCYYINGNGNMSGTHFKMVTTGYNSTALTRKEEGIALGTGIISGNIKTQSFIASGNIRDLTSRRVHIEVKLQSNMLGSWNRFIGCEVDILTSQLF